MKKATQFFLMLTTFLLLAGTGIAQEDQGGCVYNRAVYPEGSEMCQSGSLMRCGEGAWGDIGFCDQEPMPEPVSGGGDRVVPPEQ